MIERSWTMATIPVELAQELVDAHPLLHELIKFHHVGGNGVVPGYASPNYGPNDRLVQSAVDAGHLLEDTPQGAVVRFAARVDPF